MKKYKFEIEITEQDVDGDEFWEDAIEKDGTGITDLTAAICQAITDSNLIFGSEKNSNEIVKLIKLKLYIKI